MTTSETVVFQWKKIGEPARICHKVKGLVHNLAAVANLVDEGHEVTFREHDAIVTNKQNDIMLRGWRDLSNRLWRVPIDDDGQNKPALEKRRIHNVQVHSVYDCKGERAITKFYHATLFSPVKSTLLKAIKKGYLRGWSGLNA